MGQQFNTSEDIEAVAGTQSINTSTSSLQLHEKIETTEHQPSSSNHTTDTADTSNLDEPLYPTGLPLALTLFAAALSIFLVSLDSTIISTAIPSIVDQFHQLNHVAWYGSAYMLGMGTTQCFWGQAYKYWSIKYVYLLSLVIFETGTLICGVAPNSTVLILGRAIAGSGGAGVAAGTFLIVAVTSPTMKRPLRLGVISICFVVAAMAGPLAGGALTEHLSWRWCFYVSLPLGGISLISIFFFFSTPSHASPIQSTLRTKLLGMDILGMLTTVGLATCLVQGLQWAGVIKPWSSAAVIGLLAAAGTLLVCLAVVEHFLGDRAGINPRIIKQKTIALQLVYTISIAGVYYILLYYLPLYFQVVRGVEPTQSGLRTLALIGTSATTAMISGILLSKTGEYQVIMFLSSSFTAVGSALIYTFSPDSSNTALIGYQILVGIGLGLSIQLSIVVCQNMVHGSDLSQANSLALWMQLLGGALVLAVAQCLMSNRLLYALPDYAPTVSANMVITAGPTDLRTLLDPEELQGVVDSYMSGLKGVFALATGLACAAGVVATLVIVADRRRLGEKPAEALRGPPISSAGSSQTALNPSKA